MARIHTYLAALLTLAPGLAAQAGAPGAQATAWSPAAALVPDTVLAPTGGPRIVLLAAPGEGVAALRLFVPLQEAPVEGGAGWLLKELGLEQMRTLARPVGARVSASRTPRGIAYAVEGAVADFEYLAYLLREAVSLPPVNTPAFGDALRRLREAGAAALETPQGRVAADLRAQIAQGHPPLEGTPGSTAAMDGARVREVWEKSHVASAMTLVVSAPVIPEVVLAATRGMGAPESPEPKGTPGPAPPEPRRTAPQSLRGWYGEAWHGGEPDDPRGPVAALLVSEHVRSSSTGFEATVELRELPDRWVITVVGAGYGRTVTPMRRAVGAALAGARDGLHPARVDHAVSVALGDLLFRARTPHGLVEVVGRAMEAHGDPMAAARQAETLDAVDLSGVRSFLEELLARGSVRAEVRP